MRFFAVPRAGGHLVHCPCCLCRYGVFLPTGGPPVWVDCVHDCGGRLCIDAAGAILNSSLPERVAQHAAKELFAAWGEAMRELGGCADVSAPVPAPSAAARLRQASDRAALIDQLLCHLIHHQPLSDAVRDALGLDIFWTRASRVQRGLLCALQVAHGALVSTVPVVCLLLAGAERALYESLSARICPVLPDEAALVADIRALAGQLARLDAGPFVPILPVERPAFRVRLPAGTDGQVLMLESGDLCWRTVTPESFWGIPDWMVGDLLPQDLPPQDFPITLNTQRIRFDHEPPAPGRAAAPAEPAGSPYDDLLDLPGSADPPSAAASDDEGFLRNHRR